jgi:spore coat polysaccharide biosynthesis protein SpsF
MIGCIIQARMGSTRLPGKVLKNIEKNKTVLYFVIKQLQESKLIDKIVVATTNLEEDNKIVEYSKKLGIECFRGDSKNVLKRHYECAKKFSMSTIVRIPSDKPLIDPTIVDQNIKFFNENSCDYVTNFLPKSTFPSGTEVEIFHIMH